MKYNLKNRPDLDEIAKKNPNKSLTWLVADYHGKATKWFEGFEKQQRSFRDSKIQCVEWLQKYTMIDPLDDMKLTQCQAVLRTFIQEEVLGVEPKIKEEMKR